MESLIVGHRFLEQAKNCGSN